jgi:hypothetical protein
VNHWFNELNERPNVSVDSGLILVNAGYRSAHYETDEGLHMNADAQVSADEKR